MERNGKMTEVKCESCHRVMFRRRGNTIVAFGFEIDLPRSRNIRCQCGHEGTRFCVDRQQEKVSNTGRI